MQKPHLSVAPVQEGSESVETIATKWTTQGDKTEQSDL